MKYLILYYIAIALILIGCTEKPNEKSIIVDIDYRKPIPSKTFFESARIIPLESIDSAMVSLADKIVIYKEHIHIYDRKQNALFVFEKNGDFLFKIDQQGRGPEEYKLLYDININHYTETLELLDPMGALLSFNLQGQFISKYTLPRDLLSYSKFALINQDTIAFSCIASSQILHLYSRKSNKLISHFIDVERKNHDGPSFYYYQDSCYFSLALFDQIYNISSGKPHISYEWYFPGHDYDPFKNIPDYDRNSYQEFMKVIDNLPYRYGRNLQNQRYRYATIVLPKETEWTNIFHDKITNQSYAFTRLDGDVPFRIEYMDDNIALSTIYSFELENFPHLKILDKESREILKNYDTDSNLLLIEYKFKKP